MNEQKLELTIVPIKEWPKIYGYPSLGTLKYLALRRQKNGFSRCVKMINHRLYLHIEETQKYFKELKDIY